MQRSGEYYRQYFEWLGIDYRLLDHVHMAGDMRVASERLIALQANVSSAWKRVAFDLHPDRNGGDAEATERFKLLSEFVRESKDWAVRSSRVFVSDGIWAVPLTSSDVSELLDSIFG